MGILCKINPFCEEEITKEDRSNIINTATTAASVAPVVGNALTGVSVAQVFADSTSAAYTHASSLAMQRCSDPDKYTPVRPSYITFPKNIIDSIDNADYHGANCSIREEVMCVWAQQVQNPSLSHDQVIQNCGPSK